MHIPNCERAEDQGYFDARIDIPPLSLAEYAIDYFDGDVNCQAVVIEFAAYLSQYRLTMEARNTVLGTLPYDRRGNV